MPIDHQLFFTLHKVTVNDIRPASNATLKPTLEAILEAMDRVETTKETFRGYLADLDDLMQLEADCEALVQQQQQQQQEQEDVEEDVEEEVGYLTPTEDEASDVEELQPWEAAMHEDPFDHNFYIVYKKFHTLATPKHGAPLTSVILELNTTTVATASACCIHRDEDIEGVSFFSYICNYNEQEPEQIINHAISGTPFEALDQNLIKSIRAILCGLDYRLDDQLTTSSKIKDFL
ncbi:hypothetical protein BDB00DRAFT_880503 [Zychaea mexicana]|uniref:uncharacterized protein n=1 Tax=Zychaea mexicana TaxID=64656 RepID=UPI0022FF4462|nr:uncharacterized protein BDB00DRAFT_880503 [Zychaea mexicana]KAI9467615.1 hypothetical protein BDB00DRAFT_880503 [Zychaea mexicana]